MGFFDEAVAAAAEGRRPHAAILTDHHFNAGHRFNWTGLFDLDFDGEIWKGTGDVVSFGPMDFSADDGAPGFKATLSGVDAALVAEARNDPSVRGRSATYYLLFFDPDTLQPLGVKYLLKDFVMDVMGYSGVGPNMRAISVSYEDRTAGLKTASYGRWSPADQEARFPGDRGLEFVAEFVPGLRTQWPDFDA